MLRVRTLFLRRFLQETTNRQRSTLTDVTSETRSAEDVTTTSAEGKLPARPPLVKNFFVGNVDKELLAFPEVIARDAMAKLQQHITPLQNYFDEALEVQRAGAPRAIAHEELEKLQQLGLYAVNVPRDFDGMGWSFSESLLATEPEAQCTDVTLNLLPHRVVIDVLNELGNVQQQQRFLPQLASGTLVAADAMFEYEPAEYSLFNTSADFQPESQSWLLNGEKAFVLSGPLLPDTKQLFLVLAQSNRMAVHNSNNQDTTAFLVDASTPGVSISEPQTTLCARGTHMRRIEFKQVLLPASSVVGEPHDGVKVVEVLLRSNRLRGSLVTLGAAKQTLRTITQHCLNTRQCGVDLVEMESSKMLLSQAMCNIYGMESLIYFTAGLLDEFNQQDVQLETAMTKFYTAKQLLHMVENCVGIIGPKALVAGEPFELAFRNAAQLYALNETMDSLQFYIAMTGLQYAGTIIGETVAKSRNPLFHPGHVFSKFLQSDNIDNPKTNLRLGDYLHPSLAPAAQCLETSVKRLQMCSEMLLTRYGSTVVERHAKLRRLAELSTLVYTMYASVSRASRSYCIGLHLADHELLLASTIAMLGHDRVKTLSEEIFNGEFVNGDSNLRRLSKQVLKSGGYFSTHPLTYNF